MSSQRSPRDIVLGLLSQREHADGQDEDDETRRKRHKAAFWGRQLLDASEDKALAGVIGSEVFWQALLYAFQAGCWHTILDLYRDPQILTDLLKAQAFQSGRSPNELTRRLETSYLELRAKRGRPPKLREVAEAAGGQWIDVEDPNEAILSLRPAELSGHLFPGGSRLALRLTDVDADSVRRENVFAPAL